MSSLNNSQLIGNLGKDPDVKYFDNGNKVVNITIATSENWTDKQTGEKKSLTDWHNCRISGGLADVAEKYLKKGSKVYISGKLRTTTKEDHEGVKRYYTNIIVKNLIMLDGRPQDQSTTQNDSFDNHDDLPFDMP